MRESKIGKMVKGYLVTGYSGHNLATDGICKHCGKKFFASISDLARKRGGIFCSYSCQLYGRKKPEHTSALNHHLIKMSHTAVLYAIREGVLIKPELCQKCNAKELINAHHEDYAKPLEVMWLCTSCHKLLHLNKLQTI